MLTRPSSFIKWHTKVSLFPKPPRRFGKSLLLSTFKAYFEGKKELFRGLAIEKLETEWKEHPVLHFSLNAELYDSRKALENMLERQLREWEKYMIPEVRVSPIPDGS